jgi:hypothetical protein
MLKSQSVAHALLRHAPFDNLPLHIRFFTAAAESIFKAIMHPLPATLSTTLDLAGVSGSKELDVTDSAFRTAAWVKSSTLLRDPVCDVCHGAIDLAVSGGVKPGRSVQLKSQEAFDYSICPTPTCSFLAHLPCLAGVFSQAIVPREGKCPECLETIEWGEVIRGCFGRTEPPEVKRRRKGRIEDQDDATGSDDSSSVVA